MRKELQAADCNFRGAPRIYDAGRPLTTVPKEMPVDLQHIVVPSVLFLCVTYGFKVAVDAVVRYRMFKEGVSESLLQTILLDEQMQRRMAALRWGIFLVAIGISFALIKIFGWTDVGPASVAVVAICAGLGLLTFHAITRRRD